MLLAADPDSRRWSPSLRTVDDKAGAEAWIANRLRRRTDWAVENEASHRLAERVGYRQEGVHRQSYRTGDGVLRDEHSHARLASDPPPEPPA